MCHGGPIVADFYCAGGKKLKMEGQNFITNMRERRKLGKVTSHTGKGEEKQGG